MRAETQTHDDSQPRSCTAHANFWCTNGYKVLLAVTKRTRQQVDAVFQPLINRVVLRGIKKAARPEILLLSSSLILPYMLEVGVCHLRTSSNLPTTQL